MNVDALKVAMLSGLIVVLGASKVHAQQPLSHQQVINERTAPVGQVNVAGESSRGVGAQPAMLSGKERYEASCGFCHDTGTAGSPKIGVKSVWAPRLAKGRDTLVTHAINGIGTMPAKGMCPSCSDEEIEIAVQYMIDQSK